MTDICRLFLTNFVSSYIVNCYINEEMFWYNRVFNFIKDVTENRFLFYV